MKKLLLLAMVLGLLVSGCVGAGGWTRKDHQLVDKVQLEKDRNDCNRGWGVCLAVDIFITSGFASLIHYFEASHCMKVKGYEKIPKPQLPEQPTTSSGGDTGWGK